VITGSRQHPVLESARLYAPLLCLFGCGLLALWPLGEGGGLLFGWCVGLAVTLHGLVFGAQAAMRAFPPLALRLLMAVGACAIATGLVVKDQTVARYAYEGGVLLVAGAGSVLTMLVLFARARTLREGGDL
jgi:multisubunit Na+/H+ antiporter MnhB subunit